MVIVKKKQAYRFRIYPTEAQEQAFRQISGCCRLVYNLGLEQRRDHWRRYRARTGFPISKVSQKNELPALKEVAPFLKEAPSHCLQQALDDLDRAYQNFFEGRASYPTPRRKMDGDSFRFPDNKQFRLRRGWLIAPKFGRRGAPHGPIRIKRHRAIHGTIKNITIIRDGSHWYASIIAERVAKVRTKSAVQEDRVAGLDRGVRHPVALSSGELLGSLVEGPREMERLRRLQRDVSRKKKGSVNRAKAIRRLAEHKAKMARRRRDMIQKMTNGLVKNHDVIVIEDLRVANMTRSAKGAVDEPGRNVRQKSGLNRSILDKGWGYMRQCLAYKAAWAGKRLVEVDPRMTSRTCAECGIQSVDSRNGDRFNCVGCGHQDHADINAARNIRARGIDKLRAEGLSVAACGELCAGISEAGRGRDPSSFSESALPAQ
jgi:putative transposase